MLDGTEGAVELGKGGTRITHIRVRRGLRLEQEWNYEEHAEYSKGYILHMISKLTQMIRKLNDK